MSFERINEDILFAVRAVQALVDAEVAKHDGTPPKGSALDQTGLRNGEEIVTQYIRAGEPGLALELLVEIVEETSIEVSSEAVERIRRAAAAMGMKVRI